MNEKVLDLVYAAIAELNDTEEGEGGRIPLAPDTALFGRGGRLDSLGLVNLIITTEQRIEDEFGRSVTLADERAMSMESSPFATVASFVAYIEMLLAEPENG